MPESVVGSVERQDVDGVVVLRLSRPGRANAWGPDMSQALVDRLAAARADRSVRACVLTGEGDKAFSSGADIGDASSHRTPSAGEFLDAFDRSGHPVFDALANFPKPLITAINGYAIGAGFLLALHSDVILAAPNAQFAMPQVRLGVLPAYGALYRLAQWVGRGRALEIVLSGRRVDATEAAAIGIAHQVVPSEDLEKRAVERARALGDLPPLAVKLAKDSLETAYELNGGRATALMDSYRFGALGLTEDSLEAHAAWREKRPPVFGGR